MLVQMGCTHKGKDTEKYLKKSKKERKRGNENGSFPRPEGRIIPLLEGTNLRI